MTPEEAARELAGIAADLRVYLEANQSEGRLTLPRGELPPRRVPGPSKGPYASEGDALSPGPTARPPGRQEQRKPRSDSRGRGASRSPAPSWRKDSAPAPPPPRRPPPLRVPELGERSAKSTEAPAPARRQTRKPGAGKWGAYAGRRDPDAELAAIRAASGRRCPVCENIIVIGEGSTRANLFIVGSAEDKRPAGRPFDGAPGEMLDKMVSHVLGLRRDQVFVADICPCTPPNSNEAPTRGSCVAALHAQINAVRPLVILSMGRPATQALVGGRRGFTALQGRWQKYDGRLPVMPTFHPSWLTENPGDKRRAFEDLKAAAAKYREQGGQ